MSQRTNASLYDNAVPRCAPWNNPPELKFKEGDHVTSPNGRQGRVSSLIPAFPTSAMRCRDHAYYVSFPGCDPVLFFEREITPTKKTQQP